MKPPFTYFGGKTSVADQIVRLLPAHEHYVEPFAGSLAVLLAKRPSPAETVNDINHDLMTFWRVLRERPADLEAACLLTPHSRAEHAQAWVPAADELEQARRVWVRLTQDRGRSLLKSGWRHCQAVRNSSDSVPSRNRGSAQRIKAVAARLERVSLECRPAAELIAAYGAHPSTLIYADPPYLGALRNGASRYVTELATEDQHRELAGALRAARASVVLSGYSGPLYDTLYDGWHRYEISTQTGNGDVPRRTEVLWSNRPFPAVTQPLWEAAMPP